MSLFGVMRKAACPEVSALNPSWPNPAVEIDRLEDPAETGTKESEPLFQFSTVRSMWPARPPLPADQLLYERRNGKFVLQVTGHPDYGVPFGQDRIVPIF